MYEGIDGKAAYSFMVDLFEEGEQLSSFCIEDALQAEELGGMEETIVVMFKTIFYEGFDDVGQAAGVFVTELDDERLVTFQMFFIF